VWEVGKLKIKHVESKGLWLMTRGGRLLYCGRLNPWQSPGVIAGVLRREGKPFRYQYVDTDVGILQNYSM
jgi:hypothetical protein